jgi:predicted transcriptional regulator
MDISLTDREADVMQVLWDHGPSVVAEVRAHLSDNLAYTTVLTILRTLEAKSYVRHEEEGRGHRYIAGVLPQAARKSALKHLTDKLFKGSSELLFTHLVSDQKLTPEQVRRMRQLLAGKDGDAKDAGAKVDAHKNPPSDTQRRKER